MDETTLMSKEVSRSTSFNEWIKRKNEVYRRFLEDIEIGYADRDIIDFIKLVFTKKKIYTTSSCSGRITVIDASYPWLREESYVLYKKHEPVTVDDIERIIYSHIPKYRFWLVASGPILHFIALDLESASLLLKIVHGAGFKHSGIISLGESGIVIETVSGTWTSFLLKEGSELLVSDLAKIVKIANEVLIEGKKRLEKLFKVIKETDI
ncbi:MAG: hypothetical protein QXK54_04790 [Ignisphaera sp.]